jgi:hypothetical protein
MITTCREDVLVGEDSGRGVDKLKKCCNVGTRGSEGLKMASSKVVPDLGLLSLNSASRNSRVSIISPWAVKY